MFVYGWFYIDLWSFVHLTSGALLFVVLTAYRVQKRWLYTLMGLILYELVENPVFVAILRVFKPEKIVDVLNDIFIGMVGALLIWLLLERAKERLARSLFTVLLPSLLLSFLWVGWYGYEYSVETLNSSTINLWALMLWTLGGAGMIVGYIKLKERFVPVRALLTYIVIYFSLLFIVEYIGYHLLGIKEIAHKPVPLIFNIIHGEPMMHLFYMTAPLYFIAFYRLFNTLLAGYRGHFVVKKVTPQTNN